MEDLLIGDAAAQYLGLSRQRLYQLAVAGEIGTRIGGHWVFSRSELDTFKQLERKGGRPPTSEAGMLAQLSPA